MTKFYPTDFIKFEGSPKHLSYPYVTITKHKTLNLSVGFIKKAKQEILNNEYLILYYSVSTNSIAIKFTNDTSIKGIVKVSFKKDKKNILTGGAAIALRAFLTTYKDNINFDNVKLKRLIAELVDLPELEKTWIINLNQ